MVAAYEELHAQQLAHSVEVWAGGRLLAGLYLVALGRAVFGESMFTRVTDGSKIALAALVAFCRTHALPLIDCQQNTRHLASLGAAPMPRADFAAQVALLAAQPNHIGKMTSLNLTFDEEILQNITSNREDISEC